MPGPTWVFTALICARGKHTRHAMQVLSGVHHEPYVGEKGPCRGAEEGSLCQVRHLWCYSMPCQARAPQIVWLCMVPRAGCRACQGSPHACMGIECMRLRRTCLVGNGSRGIHPSGRGGDRKGVEIFCGGKPQPSTAWRMREARSRPASPNGKQEPPTPCAGYDKQSLAMAKHM